MATFEYPDDDDEDVAVRYVRRHPEGGGGTAYLQQPGFVWLFSPLPALPLEVHFSRCGVASMRVDNDGKVTWDRHKEIGIGVSALLPGNEANPEMGAHIHRLDGYLSPKATYAHGEPWEW